MALALPKVRVSELPFAVPGFAADDWIYPCCRTLPMGWSHAPFLAQAVHRFIVREHTSLCDENELSPTSTRSLDAPRHAVYIDDMNLFGVDCPDELNRLLEEYLQALVRCGFPPEVVEGSVCWCTSHCSGLEGRW